MEPLAGGNPFQSDRPGTRMRIVLRPDVGAGETLAARARGTARWLFKLLVALAMGVFCAAVASYAPVGGTSFAAFVPPDCTLFVHAPSGAALHRALLDSPAFNALLDDPDTAAFIASFVSKKTSIAGDDAESNEPANLTLRSHITDAYAKLPWPVAAFMPLEASSFYPIVGGETALSIGNGPGVAYNRHDDAKPVKAKGPAMLVFTRLSGSRGHLARMAAAFIPASSNVKVFDLGGGTMAVGLNGATPADAQHAQPMVLSAPAQSGTEAQPLLSISFSPKSMGTPAAVKDQPLDMNNPTLARLFEEDVPEAVLRALVNPPTVGDMLNWKTPPALARLDFFAAPEGNFVARGRIEGDVPPFPQTVVHAHNAPPRAAAFADFMPTGPIAEFVLPIDLRACFMRHVQGAMKLTGDTEGLTKGQRLWMGRLRVLGEDRVDLDASFWPAIGHVAMLEIHESKKDEGVTPMGIIKAWLPCDIKNPETYFAAADLARARFDYVFDSMDHVTVKSQFVKRFRSELETGDKVGDRFVLATGKINAPAWSLGPKGFRITTDAGALALLNGPQESDFIAPPKTLDAYRVRLDGPRMAATVESLVTLYYDETEVDLGSQKFLALHPDRKLHIRVANKLANVLGKLALEIVPDATGAEMNLKWVPGFMPATQAASKAPSDTNSQDKKESKKPDDDDAPPPPPAN